MVGYTYRSKSSWEINESQESNDPNRYRMSLHACRQSLRLLCCLALKMLKDLNDCWCTFRMDIAFKETQYRDTYDSLPCSKDLSNELSARGIRL